MRQDEIVTKNSYTATFELENTSNKLMYYDVWVTSDSESLKPEVGLYQGEIVLGGQQYRTLSVPIWQIKPDTLKVYWVCVKEKPEEGQFAVSGMVCAKLRLYWPLQELSTLQ